MHILLNINCIIFQFLDYYAEHCYNNIGIKYNIFKSKFLCRTYFFFTDVRENKRFCSSFFLHQEEIFVSNCTKPGTYIFNAIFFHF